MNKIIVRDPRHDDVMIIDQDDAVDYRGWSIVGHVTNGKERYGLRA